MPKSKKSIIRREAGRGLDALNRAGGLAFQSDPLSALYKQVATSLWSGDGYYERRAEWFKRFQDNVSAALAEDIHFPFQLAAYARDKKGLALRTSPLGLYVEASAHPAVKGTGLVRQYAPRILRRADEPARAIAYWKTHHSGSVPHGLLRGIADVLPSFDEYALSKYKESGEVSLRDVLRLARPRPVDEEQRALWGRAVAKQLATPYTWETELSQASNDEEKREAWNRLIRSGKLGIFALVRNLRNIVKYEADVEEALSQITRERVTGSGILPFQWYRAYQAIEGAAGKGIAAPLQQAVEWSLADLPRLAGITLVACDNSGSMTHVRRARGLSNAEIANLMGAMALACSEAAYVGTFGDTFALAPGRPEFGLFENKRIIDRTGKKTGHSTDAWKVIQALNVERVHVDRIILFSDMQCYDSAARHHPFAYAGHSLSTELESYRQSHPGVILYSVNLETQDNSTQFAEGQPVVELAGWSESIFQFIASLEAGSSVLEEIRKNY